MSSVFAHALAGMGVWAVARRSLPLEDFRHPAWLAAAAVAGALPDIDSLASSVHRGPTHSLGFAVGVAGALAVGVTVARGRREALWLWPALAAAIWLHPIMDLLTGGGPGVRLFWPFWTGELEPVTGGLPIHLSLSGWSHLSRLATDPWTWRGMIYEAAIFAPLAAAAMARRRQHQAALAAAGVLAWTACAALGV